MRWSFWALQSWWCGEKSMIFGESRTFKWFVFLYGCVPKPITINVSGVNTHLPTILMFTRATSFWPKAICHWWSRRNMVIFQFWHPRTLDPSVKPLGHGFKPGSSSRKNRWNVLTFDTNKMRQIISRIDKTSKMDGGNTWTYPIHPKQDDETSKDRCGNPPR